MMVGWAPLAEDLSILPGRLPVVQPADHVGFYLGPYAKAVQIAGSSYSVAKQGTDEYLGYQHHAVAAAPGSHLPVPSGDPSQAGFSVDIVHNGPPGRTGPALAPSAANLPEGTRERHGCPRPETRLPDLVGRHQEAVASHRQRGRRLASKSLGEHVV